MILEMSSLTRHTLAGQVALVSGAGRGIGFETAHSLLWLGARVVLAEVDKSTGRQAKRQLQTEFGAAMVSFVQANIGSEQAVARLKHKALKRFGKVDIVINNATITPMGAVQNVPIKDWDASYRVNFRGPVLLARAFLPEMLARNEGVFMCVSSVGAEYMGAYESFKAAQVHLANTLDAELAETNVHAFAIGPGLVRTPGAQAGIAQLAPLYGKSIEEFYAISEAHIISVEEAGAGFAAAVALAADFRGQEISSKQALIAAGVTFGEQMAVAHQLSAEQAQQALLVSRRVYQTLKEQSDGWLARSSFERQWMLRDFKKFAAITIDQSLERLHELLFSLEKNEAIPAQVQDMLANLERYYGHMQELARGYERNQQKLAENQAVIQSWRDEVKQLIHLLDGNSSA